MEPDSTLKEIHAMKEDLAREVNYDLHAFFERLRAIEAQDKDLVVSLPLREKKASVPEPAADLERGAGD